MMVLRMQQRQCLCCPTCGNILDADAKIADAVSIALVGIVEDTRLAALDICPRCKQPNGEPWSADQVKKITRLLRRRAKARAKAAAIGG